MSENAQMFSQDQVQAFLTVVSVLVLMNFGMLVKSGIGYLRKRWKNQQDLNAAFRRIRFIENHLKIKYVENLENSNITKEKI
jgi:hypothetical protein